MCTILNFPVGLRWAISSISSDGWHESLPQIMVLCIDIFLIIILMIYYVCTHKHKTLVEELFVDIHGTGMVDADEVAHQIIAYKRSVMVLVAGIVSMETAIYRLVNDGFEWMTFILMILSLAVCITHEIFRACAHSRTIIAHARNTSVQLSVIAVVPDSVHRNSIHRSSSMGNPIGYDHKSEHKQKDDTHHSHHGKKHRKVHSKHSITDPHGVYSPRHIRDAPHESTSALPPVLTSASTPDDVLPVR
jgi:hypothetical protein